LLRQYLHHFTGYGDFIISMNKQKEEKEEAVQKIQHGGVLIAI
jgi:hypothetical protein